MLSREWVMGKYNCSAEVAEQAIQGFENFLRFFETSNLQFAHTEVELVSKEHKFGGCNDSVLTGPHGYAIGDFKTSNSVYAEMLAQVAGYGILWDENYPQSPITGGYHIFRFSKENADFAHHFWSELDDAKEQFLLLRRAYELDKRLKKRV